MAAAGTWVGGHRTGYRHHAFAEQLGLAGGREGLVSALPRTRHPNFLETDPSRLASLCLSESLSIHWWREGRLRHYKRKRSVPVTRGN